MRFQLLVSALVGLFVVAPDRGRRSPAPARAPRSPKPDRRRDVLAIVGQGDSRRIIFGD